jgi:hypothetical protein
MELEYSSSSFSFHCPLQGLSLHRLDLQHAPMPFTVVLYNAGLFEFTTAWGVSVAPPCPRFPTQAEVLSPAATHNAPLWVQFLNSHSSSTVPLQAVALTCDLFQVTCQHLTEE